MLIVFITIIAVGAAAPNQLGTIVNDFHDQNISLICETASCTQEASRVLKKIDPDVDPCNNFYRFACGKFIKEMVVPNDTSEINTFSLIRQKLNHQIRHILSDEVKKNDLPVFQSIKSYYKTCMNTEKASKNIENDLKDILKTLGDWPILAGLSWDENNFTWEKVVSEAGKMGYNNVLFFLSVYVDDDRIRNDNSKYIIQIDSPLMLQTPKRLRDSTNASQPVIKAYLNFISGVAEILGADIEVVKKDFTDLLEFEHKLKNITSGTKTTEVHLATVKQLKNKYPQISWTKYLNGILAPDAYVDQYEQVEILNENYIKAFYSLITKTPKRVIANYVQWKIIQESIINTQVGRLADALAEYWAVLSSTRKLPSSRQNWCIDQIKNMFPIASGALYVRNYFDKNMKANAASLVKNIHNSFRDIIEQANWMDSETKKQALNKLDWMKEVIGYPNELMDDNKLNEYYKDLVVYPESYLKSWTSVEGLNIKQNMLKLRKTKNDVIWQSFSNMAETNAFYLLYENLIVIGAGILQEQLFRIDRPNYMNYGGIGWLIGHEITHAFDSLGSNYDKDGNYADWWNTKTREIYLNNVRCIIEQYNNYTVPAINIRINGDNSQGENIADNGGLKAAYYAYNEWAKNNDSEPQLPGLDYTPEQMFWISVATSRCEKRTPQYLKELVSTDEHPPDEFRVIGSVSNIPEFSRDFQCPLGSPMNPAKKCSVW